MRGEDDRWLYTAPCGTRAKWPSERRTPISKFQIFLWHNFSILFLDTYFQRCHQHFKSVINSTFVCLADFGCLWHSESIKLLLFTLIWPRRGQVNKVGHMFWGYNSGFYIFQSVLCGPSILKSVWKYSKYFKWSL